VLAIFVDIGRGMCDAREAGWASGMREMAAGGGEGGGLSPADLCPMFMHSIGDLPCWK